MNREEILTVDFDATDVTEAVEAARFFDQNKHANRVDLKDDRDVIGALGHLAVETCFANAGVPYHSTRSEKYKKGGDKYDLLYADDFIDIKSTVERGGIHRFYYNVPFLVLQSQLDNPKTDLITHFCFVTVEPDYRRAHVYGVISRLQFLEHGTPRILKYENMEIRSHQLTPLRKYIFKV